MADWFYMGGEEALRELGTGRKGLGQAEAERRLAKYGENVLKEKERPQWWQVFLAQFEDLLVIILIGAAAVSMLTGDPESALVIFSVLLLNAVLGTVQHQRAEKSLDSLRRLSSPEAGQMAKVRPICSRISFLRGEADAKISFFFICLSLLHRYESDHAAAAQRRAV